MTQPLHETLLLLGANIWHDNYILESPLRNRRIPYNLTIVENHIDLKALERWTLHVSIAAPVTVMRTGVTLNDVTTVLYYANQFRRIDTNEKLTHFIESLEQDDGYPETAERPA